MTVAVIFFGLVAALGVGATVRAVLRDGYRRIPVRSGSRDAAR